MKQFSLYGMELKFPTSVENFAYIYRIHNDERIKYLSKFDDMYISFGSMDNLIKQYEDKAYSLILEYVNFYVDKIVDHGIYNIDAKKFLTDYVSVQLTGLKSTYAFEKISEKYIEIVADKEAAERYRAERKANRGRWVGGGFGLEGAIGGALEAGALNLVGGIGHSIVNGMGNLISSGIASLEKKSLYKSEDTKKLLKDAFSSDLWSIFFGYADYLPKVEKCSVHVRYSSDSSEVETTIHNIEGRNLDLKTAKPIIEKMFSTDPYNWDLYSYCYDNFGDKNGELERLGEYFCVSYVKTEKYNALVHIYNESKRNTYWDYVALQSSLEKYTAENHMLPESCGSLITEVVEKKEKLYEEARVFEGITYSTPDDAQKAQNEKKDLYKIFASVKRDTIENLEIGLAEIKKYKGNLYPKDKFICDLQSLIDAKVLENEEANLQNLVSSISDMNKDELISLETKIQNLDLHFAKKTPYLSQVQNLIHNYEINQRTVNGYIYDTLEEATKAKERARINKKFIEGLLTSINNSNDFNEINSLIQKIIESEIPEVEQSFYSSILDDAYSYFTIALQCASEQHFNNGDYAGAINCINGWNLPGEYFEQIKKSLNAMATEKFKDEISNLHKDDFKFSYVIYISIFCAIVIWLSYLLGRLIPVIPQIIAYGGSLLFVGCAIWAFFDEKTEKEKARKILQPLINLGYDL